MSREPEIFRQVLGGHAGGEEGPSTCSAGLISRQADDF